MSPTRQTCLYLLASLAVLLASVARAADLEPDEHYNVAARFTVTTDVVLPDMPAFTATAGAFGNSLIKNGGGFEPVVWRTKYSAREGSPDRVVVGESINRWDTLREGFLDGGSVRIYRVENGRFRLVRQDAIPEGGFHCSGWLGVTGQGRVVPPDEREFVHRWDDWNRPGVPYYFTVTAVDAEGRESEPAEAVSVVRPEQVGRESPDNALKQVKLPDEPPPGGAPSPPGGLRGEVLENGNYRLSWKAPEAGEPAGYRVYRSDYPPQEHAGFYIQLASHPADQDRYIRAGDMVIASKKFYSFSRNVHHSNRVWGAGQANKGAMPGLVGFYPDEGEEMTWGLVPHGDQTPVEGGGETCLRLELGEGTGHALATYNHSGTGQYWYPVLDTEPYRVEVWLRREGPGDSPVVFRLNGFYGDKIEPISFDVGKEWRKCEATFIPPVVQEGKRPNQMRLEFEGPGIYYVDNFRVYRADTDYLALLPRDLEALRDSAMMSLRTHGPIKTGTDTYDMQQFTNPGGAISGVRYQNTLPQMLTAMREARVRPWLQVEMHMGPQEWLGFVEYMAAPYDPDRDTPQSKPWAHKRYFQGQRRPWTEEFDRIYFELSNETWNWLFRPWIFERMRDAVTGEMLARGEVYGLYQEYVRSAMRSSPYWEGAGLDEKFVFVLGGWSGQRYGRNAARRSPNSDYMTIAAYNGGWDEGEGPPQLNDPSFFNVLAQVNQTAVPRADRHLGELLELNEGRVASPLRLGTYEAGPGYALNGLNNARVTPEQARQQELVMKSLAAGTATLDSFLARAARGFVIQNFFTFSRGRTWSSHAEWYHGGQAYPCWKVLELVNREGLGDVLRTRTEQAPGIDLPNYRRRRAVENAPLAAVYATRRGDRFNVFVISRKIPEYPAEGDDGYTPVTVELPFQGVDSITLHRMVGDPRAENVHSEEVEIETVQIPASEFSPHFELNAARGADDRGLPPAGTLLYVFEGAAAPQGERIPLDRLAEMDR